MVGTEQAQTLIVLLVAMLALTAVARHLLIPYPIVLVLGGLALGFVPELKPIKLDPELVFLVFLPPILWAAAYFTSLRDFRANLQPILLLAIGLVVATTFAVAAVARALIPGLGWAPAIALGAIVSPPDAVAATAIGRRLTIPRRLVTIIEGESLVNDASALVLYRTAIAATLLGEFALGDALVDFVYAVSIGIGVGVAIAVAARWSLWLIEDTFSEVAITLIAPYAAWVVADRLEASSVLACVAGGFYIRRHYSAVASPTTRFQAGAVWEQLIFFLNGAIFVLIGLQLGVLRATMPEGQFATAAAWGGAIAAVCIGVRLVWVPLVAWLRRRLSAQLRKRDPMPPASALFVLSWTGMRGIVTLAAALSLPEFVAPDLKFPKREEMVVIAFVVILVTLVLQGLTLPPLLRWLRFADDGTLEREERHAREQASAAALEAVARLASESWAHADTVERMRTYYSQRDRSLSRLDVGEDETSRKRAAAYRRLRHDALLAERMRLIQLRDEGSISDEVLQRLEHELDVEAMRMGAGGERLERVLHRSV
jgi:monovalent cation/hydrogen antiporter